MQIDPDVFEVTIAVPSCPECGCKHYAVDNRLEAGGVKCESVTCAECGFDILAALRDMRVRKT